MGTLTNSKKKKSPPNGEDFYAHKTKANAYCIYLQALYSQFLVTRFPMYDDRQVSRLIDPQCIAPTLFSPSQVFPSGIMKRTIETR